MANNRVYYACQSVQIAGPSGNNGATNTVYDTVQGLQSVGIETNFNLEPIYQMGQLDLYENFEDIPDVSVSLNKALDGMPTIYSMAMGTGTLSSVAENRCSVRLTIHPDTDVSATGTPIAVCQIEPAYLSSVTYNFPSDGNFTEDVTIVGNNKSWLSSASATSRGEGMRPAADNPNSGAGIVRRQMFDQTNSLLPTVVATTNPERTQESGGIPNVSKIQSINISMDLGREEIYHLVKDFLILVLSTSLLKLPVLSKRLQQQVIWLVQMKLKQPVPILRHCLTSRSLSSFVTVVAMTLVLRISCKA